MIENVMKGIGGVGNFGIISITIFFAFFSAMLIWSVRLKKNYLNSMQALPLEEDERPEESNSANESCDGHE